MSREATFQNALSFARDLIRIPSPSGAERKVAERVCREMEELGFRDVRTDELGSVVGVIPGRGEAAPALLNCHLDVVAEGDPEAWEHPPFSGALDGGFLHGRGAMDIKGPLALQTYAAAALAGTAPGDVVVAHTVYEERGGWGMDHLLRSGGLEPGVVVIGEATHGDVAIGHRGRGEVEVLVHGEAGHASAPDRARNALDLLPEVLGAVKGLAARQESDPVLGPATLVATAVDVLPESRHVIPDRVLVALDWRILPGDTPEGLLGRVEEALDRSVPAVPDGFRLEARIATERQTTYTGRQEDRRLLTPGFLMPQDDPVVRAAAEAVGRRQGSGPALARPWTFATDGGWSRGVHGIPTIGFAPGEERYAHTNRERLDVEEARWAFERYLELIPAIQRAAG